MTKTPPKEVKTNVPIHDWKIGKLLGQGGQGGVWEVRSLKTPHSPPRAMKICTATDAASRGRFEREVATLRKVQHPGIAPLYDANVRWEVVPGTEIVCAYYVTERYPGTLASVTWWREAPIYAVAVFRQACEAIEYLHSQEPPIFHRDLKPENILFDSASERSVIAITDLGTVTGTEEGAALTQLHEVIGSRYYRSPESQYGHYDERGDVFSLGRILAWMLTGVEPKGPTPPVIPDIVPLTQEARAALNRVLERACALNPDVRYPSVTQLKNELPSLVAAILPVNSGSPATLDTNSLQGYRKAKDMLRSGDILGWFDIKKVQRRGIDEALQRWRHIVESSAPSRASIEQREHWLNEALSLLAAPLGFSLATLEAPPNPDAEEEAFRIIDHLLDSNTWKSNGLTLVTEHGPLSLTCIVHSLLGASLLMCDRPHKAAMLARRPIRHRDKEKELWSSEALEQLPFCERRAQATWRYLRSIPEQQSWLQEVYGSLEDYQVYLAAYWWILSTAEFASDAASPTKLEHSTPGQTIFEVSPLMLLEPSKIYKKGFSLALGNRNRWEHVSNTLGLHTTKAIFQWPHWKALLAGYARQIHPFVIDPEDIAIPDLP